MNDIEEADEDARRWVERSKRESLERRARDREVPWPKREPEAVRQHVSFALALSGLSADRTKRFLKWLRGQPRRHIAGGGGGGG
jgi:hypothetical protein